MRDYEQAWRKATRKRNRRKPRPRKRIAESWLVKAHIAIKRWRKQLEDTWTIKSKKR